MHIQDLLFVISLLGIAQGILITAMILAKMGRRPNKEWLLCGLFLASVVVMSLVTSVNSGLVSERWWMEVIEIFFTLLIGPMFYWYIRSQEMEKRFSYSRIGLHFSPALLWLGLVLFDQGRGVILFKFPFYIFIVHFQVYILSAAAYYFYKKVGSGLKQQQPWISLLLYFFLFLCVGQWLRFAFVQWDTLQLIVPSAAACSFYFITIIGLQRSSLWPSNVKHRKSTQTFDMERRHIQLQALELLMRKEELYRDPQLNRSKLALALDMSPNQLTILIQQSFGVGFTHYINRWRLEKVQLLLRDPACQHLTLEAIGNEAGFQSRSAFYRIFRAATGKTPASFRKEKRTD